MDEIESLKTAMKDIKNGKHGAAAFYALLKAENQSDVTETSDNDDELSLRAVELDVKKSRVICDEVFKTACVGYEKDRAQFTDVTTAADLKDSIAVIPTIKNSRSSAQGIEDPDGDESSYVERLFKAVGVLADPMKNLHERPLERSEIGNIQGFFFYYLLGDQILYAYQRTQRLWIVKNSRFLLPSDHDTKFDVYNKESVRIGNNFDFVMFDHRLFCRTLATLEQQFGYEEIDSKRARDVLYNSLPSLVIDDNGLLESSIKANDRTVIRKLRKIADSPVLGLEPSQIMRRAKRVPAYNKKNFYDADGRIKITSKTSLNLALKLLNDDILISPLLDHTYYDSKIKLAISEEDRAEA